jgi:hypothetical protein
MAPTGTVADNSFLQDRRADRGENALTIKTGLAMMHRAPDIRVTFNIGDEKLKSGARRQRSRYARRRAADVEAGIPRSKRERVLDKLGTWGDKTARALDSTFGQVIAIYVSWPGNEAQREVRS